MVFGNSCLWFDRKLWPAVICEWKPEWNAIKSSSKKAILKSRQGVNYPALDFLEVFNPKNMKPVKRDGESLGEVFLKVI